MADELTLRDVMDALDNLLQLKEQVTHDEDKSHAALVEKIVREIVRSTQERSPEIGWRRQFEDAQRAFKERFDALTAAETNLKRHIDRLKGKDGSRYAGQLEKEIEERQKLLKELQATQGGEQQPPQSATSKQPREHEGRR